MTSIVTRATSKITRFEIEVTFFAFSAEQRVLRIEFVITYSQRLLMPASNNESTSRTRTVEHLLHTFLSNAFRQDANCVHDHAGESECFWLPKFMGLIKCFFLNHFVEFHGIAL